MLRLVVLDGIKQLLALMAVALVLGVVPGLGHLPSGWDSPGTVPIGMQLVWLAVVVAGGEVPTSVRGRFGYGWTFLGQLGAWAASCAVVELASHGEIAWVWFTVLVVAMVPVLALSLLVRAVVPPLRPAAALRPAPAGLVPTADDGALPPGR